MSTTERREGTGFPSPTLGRIPDGMIIGSLRRLGGMVLSYEVVRLHCEPTKEYNYHGLTSGLFLKEVKNSGFYAPSEGFVKAGLLGKIGRIAIEPFCFLAIVLRNAVYNNTILNFQNHTFFFVDPMLLAAIVFFSGVVPVTAATAFGVAGLGIAILTLGSLITRTLPSIFNDNAVNYPMGFPEYVVNTTAKWQQEAQAQREEEAAEKKRAATESKKTESESEEGEGVRRPTTHAVVDDKSASGGTPTPSWRRGGRLLQIQWCQTGLVAVWNGTKYVQSEGFNKAGWLNEGVRLLGEVIGSLAINAFKIAYNTVWVHSLRNHTFISLSVATLAGIAFAKGYVTTAAIWGATCAVAGTAIAWAPTAIVTAAIGFTALCAGASLWEQVSPFFLDGEVAMTRT